MATKKTRSTMYNPAAAGMAAAKADNFAAVQKPAKPGALFSYEVDLGSSFGCDEPRLNVKAAPRVHFRAFRAELFRLAALIEKASIPGNEAWIVGTKVSSDLEGCVYLEVAQSGGSPARAELDRGIALLKEIANEQD